MTSGQVMQQSGVADSGGSAVDYWQACRRAYTYQPIYRTDGRLMAVEMLTVITHPQHPGLRIAPDRYFSAVSVAHRLDVIQEQLAVIGAHKVFFDVHGILASVNIDGPTLLSLHQEPRLMLQVEAMPWLRFELVEHVRLPQEATFATLCGGGPLWLDDFGTGMANFSALSEASYDYIKVARELFIMLRATEEGRNLFGQLIQLMNRYCQGVIVEGVETLDEWQDVRRSAAFAAQGYFLSHPQPFANLNAVALNLP